MLSQRTFYISFISDMREGILMLFRVGMAESMDARRKKLPVIIWVGIALVVLIAGVLTYEALKRANNIVKSQDDVIRISAIEAIREVESGKAVLLDTRGAIDYDAQHAKGALSFPLADVETRLSELDSEQYYITYCT